MLTGGSQLWQSINLIFGEAICDLHILAHGIAGVLETAVKSAQTVRNRLSRPGVDEPDHGHRRLLGEGRERPRYDAAYKSDEFSPPHRNAPRPSALQGITAGVGCV
jgi:hypothetical protein